MNLSQLRSQVQDHGYADISNSEVNAAINFAYLEVCGAAAWPFLEAGPATVNVAGSSRYANLKAALGSSGYADNSRVLGVTRGDTELGALSPDDYFAGPYNSAIGSTQPTHYTIFAGNLYIAPASTAGSALTVRFLKEPDALSADGDVPIFASRYHQLLVYAAVATLAGEDDDDGVQSRFRALFDKGLEQMKADLTIKSEGRTAPYGTEGSLSYWADRARSAGFPKATNAEVALLLQDTISDICSRYAWPFLRVDTSLTTVPGQDYVNLPTDFARSLGIYIPATGSQVNYASLSDQRFDHHPSSTSGPGIPERYSISWATPGTTTYPNRGARLILWPVPLQAYSLTVEYERRIAVNTANANAPIEWPGPGMVLELGVLYRLAMRGTDKDAASRIALFKSEYEEAITRMRNDALIEQRDRDPVVRITQTDLWDY